MYGLDDTLLNNETPISTRQQPFDYYGFWCMHILKICLLFLFYNFLKLMEQSG